MSDHPAMDEAKRRFKTFSGASDVEDGDVAGLLLQSFVLSDPARRAAKIEQLDSEIDRHGPVSLRQSSQIHTLRRQLVGMHGRLLRAGR